MERRSIIPGALALSAMAIVVTAMVLAVLFSAQSLGSVDAHRYALTVAAAVEIPVVFLICATHERLTRGDASQSPRPRVEHGKP